MPCVSARTTLPMYPFAGEFVRVLAFPGILSFFMHAGAIAQIIETCRYDCVGGCEDFSLCQKCQKTVKHEHSLRKSKVPSTSEPPKSWRHAVEERFGQEEDPAERLTHHILRTLKYRTDPNFKYTACAPVDLGLTDQELLTLEEGELNTLVPPSALDLYVPEEKLDHLLNKAARRVARLRKVGSKTEASESLTGKADNHVEVKGAKRANKKRKVE